jgi:uncharacterized PurR-regulated membrane protein YhhQ (DUF165 family)
MRFRYLDILINLFVVALMVSNLVAAKIIAIGDLRVSGAQILFPVTYIFGDIFTEVYGYSASRRAIWTAHLLGRVAGQRLTLLRSPARNGTTSSLREGSSSVPRIIVGSRSWRIGAASSLMPS